LHALTHAIGRLLITACTAQQITLETKKDDHFIKNDALLLTSLLQAVLLNCFIFNHKRPNLQKGICEASE
jgi:hypothetical protein